MPESSAANMSETASMASNVPKKSKRQKIKSLKPTIPRRKKKQQQKEHRDSGNKRDVFSVNLLMNLLILQEYNNSRTCILLLSGGQNDPLPPSSAIGDHGVTEVSVTPTRKSSSSSNISEGGTKRINDVVGKNRHPAMDGAEHLAKEAMVAVHNLNPVSGEPGWRRSTLDSAPKKRMTTGARPKSVRFVIIFASVRK